MHRRDYIPAADGKFLEWTKFLFAYVKEHADAWKLSPSDWAKITSLLKAYETAYTKAQDPNRGKGDVLEKNETRDVLESAVRQYVKEYLANNHLISDDDRKRMGLTVPDTQPTPPEPPKDEPKLSIQPVSAGILEILFGGKNEHGHAKPKGVHGIELRWVIADATPVDWSALIHSEFATRSPLRLSFEGHDRGKWIYFAGRWENTRGVKGPWTEIISAIIP